MSDKTRKNRESPISYRPPADLREEFYARVQKSGLSTNAFITQCCLGGDAPRQVRRPSSESRLSAKFLAEAAVIREQLHDASLSGGDPLLLEQAVQTLKDIRNALLTIDGRKP